MFKNRVYKSSKHWPRNPDYLKIQVKANDNYIFAYIFVNKEFSLIFYRIVLLQMIRIVCCSYILIPKVANWRQFAFN